MHQALGPATVASNVQLLLLGPRGCTITADWSPTNPALPQVAAAALGLVTEERALTCNFGCAPRILDNNADATATFQLQMEFTSPDGAQMLYVKSETRPISTDRDLTEMSLRQHVVALSALHRSASLAHSQSYTEARIELISTLRLLQRRFDISSCNGTELRRYLAFILQGERLDNFMREGLAATSVLGAKQSRDDPASKSMFQMKSLTTAAFEGTA
eukprot:m.25979 g.25979  ORF g.25979 m.25979 type:complete len:217 (-) comp11620_c0_seq1:192-842(-)